MIVEDDLVSAEYLREILKRKGYEIVDIVDTGHEAIHKCQTLSPDLILMDIMLKDNVSGSEAALKLHNDHCTAKVIFVTAYAEEEMLDYAVRSKAYGYILKPYREEEIFATVRLALSHDAPEERREQNVIPLKNGYTFHLDTQRLFLHDKEVPLAKKKRKLLEILAKNRGHSVTNEQLCLHVWGSIQNFSTLRSLVYRIRNEIGEDMIVSVNGLGYMLA